MPQEDWVRMARRQQQFQRLARALLPPRRPGVSPSECEILAHLYMDRDGLTPHALAGRSGMRQEAVSRCLHALAADGLVVRVPNPADERSRIVVLTEAGERALREGLEGVLQPFYDLSRSMGAPFDELFDLIDLAVARIDDGGESRS